MQTVVGPKALLLRVFGIPALLALATVFGLLAALLGQDGLWHILAWIALSLPLAVLAWHLIRWTHADRASSRRSAVENTNAEQTD